MAALRKTWVQKRDLVKQPKVEILQKAFADIPAGASMAIATPAMVNEYVTHIPPGTQTTLAQMRKDLAASLGAQYSCPVTAGIFLRIVAEAAWEEYQGGMALKKVAPFWRIIGPSSPTAKKLSFGTGFLLKMQQAEGIFQ
jgi:hypothetical protein